MTAPLGAPQPNPAPDAAIHEQHVKLRRLAHELEGVFLAQLFQAMRASVPQSGLTESGAGEQMFTEMLDQRMAGLAAERFQRGVGEALYRQLSRRLPPDPQASPIGAARSPDPHDLAIRPDHVRGEAP